MVRPNEMRGSQLIGLSPVIRHPEALDVRIAVCGKLLDGA